VCATARTTIAYSRAFRCALIHNPRAVFFLGTAISSIESHRNASSNLAANIL
jgi:hypothetical protein